MLYIMSGPSISLFNWRKKVVDFVIEVTDSLKIVPHCAISNYTL